jgi:hypothetical protein
MSFVPHLAAQSRSPAGSKTAVSPAANQALIQEYCVVCHDNRQKTAGVTLEGVNPANVAANGAVLEKVLRKVKSGQMPPEGMPQPAAADRSAFSSWLEQALDQEAAARPNPGRPAVHRLNRAEYSNAIRDLLALDINPGSLLPVDDSGYGFDNIGEVLSVSPALLERYILVARRIARTAIGDLNAKPVEDVIDPPQTRRGAGFRNERISEDLPFDSTGGLAARYYFPVDGEYSLKVTLALPPGAPDDAVAPSFEVRQPVSAGLRIVGATFLRDNGMPELEAPAGRRGGGGAVKALPNLLDLRLDGTRLKRFDVPERGGPPVITRLTINGPFKVTGRGDTPSRQRIFVCRPAAATEETGCAQKILAGLTRRAYRRTVTDADVKPLLAFYLEGRKQGDFDFGIQKAVQAMLVSPDFLFRVEKDHKPAPGQAAYRISDFELASRLSFFLWSSIPDDSLLNIAEKGRLHDPAVLEQQVRRMLDDPRSDALVSNFAGQWLYIRNLQTAKPDADLFPEFDDSLRRSFQKETELFFASILRENRSVLDLLGANYSFLNQRLAEHYGIPNIYGSQFRRVEFQDPNRGGLLGQGSILTVTSYPNRTSVVQRGKWILENLLGTPPPPPPPDVPPLEATKGTKKLTLREAMEVHRANPTCAGCHARMDPIGFALENYNAVGKWRDKEDGSAIDASGKLPDGTVFNGPAGLKKLLLTSRKEDFITTVAEKLLTYALGRGVEYYDQPVLRGILRDSERSGYKMGDMVLAVVKSTPFQMRRAPEP